VTVGRGDGDAVDPALDQRPDRSEHPVPVDAAVLAADRGKGRTAEQAELGIPRRLQGRTGFLGDPLDVAESEETLEAVLIVHHEQLVDTKVLGEETVGAGDGVCSQLALGDGTDLGSGGERLGDFPMGVTRLDDVTR
jgi:hypothetical protein